MSLDWGMRQALPRGGTQDQGRQCQITRTYTSSRGFKSAFCLQSEGIFASEIRGARINSVFFSALVEAPREGPYIARKQQENHHRGIRAGVHGSYRYLSLIKEDHRTRLRLRAHRESFSSLTCMHSCLASTVSSLPNIYRTIKSLAFLTRAFEMRDQRPFERI